MKSKLIYIAIMVGLFSCTDQFEEINQNPNNPVKVEPEFLLTTSLRETQNLYGGNMNGVVFYNYTHYFSGFQGSSSDIPIVSPPPMTTGGTIMSDVCSRCIRS